MLIETNEAPMNHRLPLTAAILAVLLVPAAQAADRHFCEEYARSAEREVHRAEEHPRCRHGVEGPRWTRNFHTHFEWCLRVDRREADREREIRAEHLRRCER
jgi:hypothetical protein